MNLGRVQGWSLATKAVTSALGIAQGLIVARLLTPGEFGVVGLVMAIGGVIGVSQHLGIVDGAIREIAVLRDKREIGRVFWVSHIVRQLVTIPLSAVLLLAAGFIAQRVYNRPEITTLLYIFAGVLVLQGLQDVLGATLTGMKRFLPLYGIQIITAALNVIIFGVFTWQWRVTGFFWAIVLTTIIMVGLLGAVIRRDLRGALELPSLDDVRRYGRRIFRIAVYMYLARIAFMIWQQLPILLLGRVLPDEPLGFLKVSQWFGSKLTIVAMALSEVNLSWMSSLYAEQQADFRRVATRNMQRVLVAMLGITLVLLFFTPEILFVAGEQYMPARELVIIMTVGFFLYALLDIGTSSVFVSADQPRLRAYLYGVMVAVSGTAIILLAWINPNPLLAAYAVAGSAALAYGGLVWLARQRFRINLLTPRLAMAVVLLAVSAVWLLTNPGLAVRLVAFTLLAVYIGYEAQRNKLVPAWLWRKHAVGRRHHLTAKKLQNGSVRVICFAGAPYDANTWTNRQHITSRLAQRYPVLYVEGRVWIARAVRRFFERRWLSDARGPQLHVISQWNVIPGSREFQLIARLNHALNRRLVLRQAQRLGFSQGGSDEHHRRNLIVWLYDTEAAEYLPDFPNSTVVYDCVDDHAAQAGVNRNQQRVEMEEALLLQRADLVTVTSQRLLKLKQPHSRNVHLVLNAGDVTAFDQRTGKTPAELVGLAGPVIGTVGTLDAYKFDFTLLRETAARRPHWQFVLIGRPIIDANDARRSGLTELSALPNVHLLGTRQRQDVPRYVAAFNVCIIPYRNSRYNAASFPLKFWEFMASGKPVVACGVPELQAYRDYIGYAEGSDEFITAIERALIVGEQDREARLVLAREHSWEKRTEQLHALLMKTLGR